MKTYLDNFNDILKRKLIDTGRVQPDDFKNYTIKDKNSNFYIQMTSETESAYLHGNGYETDWKIKQIRSSSAMIYNLLGNSDVEIMDNPILPKGNYKKEFEKQIYTLKKLKNPVLAKRQKPANLDAWLHNENAEIFVESKCLEWLENRKERELSSGYRKPYRYTYDDSSDMFISASKQISCQQYDSCQMFKHTLAIYNHLRENNIRGKKIILANVVWELPKNESLPKEIQKRYDMQLELEHIEFAYFKKQVKDVIDLFPKDTGCSFDIVYISVKDFIGMIKYDDEKRKYLERYL